MLNFLFILINQERLKNEDTIWVNWQINLKEKI